MNKERTILSFKLPTIWNFAFINIIVMQGYRKTGQKFTVQFNGSKGYLSNIEIFCEGNRLLKIPTAAGGDYYRKNVEIWARLFECYITLKMQKKGLTNTFLAKSPKYVESNSWIYVNSSELKKLEKEIDKLVTMFRKNA